MKEFSVNMGKVDFNNSASNMRHFMYRYIKDTGKKLFLSVAEMTKRVSKKINFSDSEKTNIVTEVVFRMCKSSDNKNELLITKNKDDFNSSINAEVSYEEVLEIMDKIVSVGWLEKQEDTDTDLVFKTTDRFDFIYECVSEFCYYYSVDKSKDKGEEMKVLDF